MSDSSSGVSLTFKAGAGFEAPWIVVHGDTPEQASEYLRRLREMGAFGAVKEAAAEFAGAPTTGQAVATVQQAFPGSQVVTTPPAPPGPPAYTQPPASPPQYQPTPPVQQGTPPCTTCGAPTTFKQGVSSYGPWSAYMCSSRIREHATFL
jgi:hypothetical protein